MKMVRKAAIGSLLPDSYSSSGWSLPRKLTLRLRRIANTAAASVEETIEPSSRHHSKEGFSVKPRYSGKYRNPAVKSPNVNSPTKSAVSSTPRLDSTLP